MAGAGRASQRSGAPVGASTEPVAAPRARSDGARTRWLPRPAWWLVVAGLAVLLVLGAMTLIPLVVDVDPVASVPYSGYD